MLREDDGWPFNYIIGQLHRHRMAETRWLLHRFALSEIV